MQIQDFFWWMHATAQCIVRTKDKKKGWQLTLIKDEQMITNNVYIKIYYHSYWYKSYSFFSPFSLFGSNGNGLGQDTT